MKQVTIDNVRERIAELEKAERISMISLRAEFELACLRQLAASLEAKPVVYSLIFRNMEGKLYDYVNVNTTFATLEEAQAYGKGGRYVTKGDGSIEWVADPSLDPAVVPLYTTPPVQVISVDDDVRSVVAMLENNEWAEHCTKTELGQRLESEITRLVGSVQPVPVTEWAKGIEPPAFGKYYVRYMTDTGPRFCIAEWLEYDCCVPNRHMVKMWLADHSRSMNALHGVTHFTRLPEWSEPKEPATDNTAQQFEALATSAGSGKQLAWQPIFCGTLLLHR